MRNRVAGFAAGILLGGLLIVPGALAQTGGSAAPGGTSPAPPPTTTTPIAPAGSYSTVQKATWYGPGLWGNRTACGFKLAPTVVGVAHKNLPCGTPVTFTYGTRVVPATVIDRGPYRKGYAWDLTKRLAKRLGFLPVGSGPIQAQISITP